MKTKEIIQQQINHSSINVSWINQPDYSNNITDLIENYKKDLGWATVLHSENRSRTNKRFKRFLFNSHDLESYNHLVNNIYKGTDHYVAEQKNTIRKLENTMGRFLFTEYKNTYSFIK